MSPLSRITLPLALATTLAGATNLALADPAVTSRIPSSAQAIAPSLAPNPILVPYRASGIYGQLERAGWVVVPPPGAVGKLSYSLRLNNRVVLTDGVIDLAKRRTLIETGISEPGMLFLEIAIPGKPSLTYGAAVDPLNLKPVTETPRDFDAFWQRKLRELRAVPENVVLTPRTTTKPGVDYGTIRMDHVNGTSVHGQLAKPSAPGKYPAMVILQWASPPYPLAERWVTDRAAEGWLALNVQPHNVLPTEAPEYYAGLPNEIKNYASIAQGDREKNYFVEMYLRGIRAVDFLAKHPNWDGKTIVVTGTSMGGQQSLAVAALHPKVTHMVVNVPAGNDLNAPFHGRQLGYPSFDMANPKAVETARYIDGLNFAPKIKATSIVSMGFVDTVTPPAGIWAAFNLIKGPKQVAPMPESGHQSTPAQSRPYTTLTTALYADILKKGKR